MTAAAADMEADIMMSSEIETTIRWDREERIAHIWTNDSMTMTKLNKKVAAHPDVYKVERETKDGVFYSCPANRINFLNPPSEARREIGRKTAEKIKLGKLTNA